MTRRPWTTFEIRTLCRDYPTLGPAAVPWRTRSAAYQQAQRYNLRRYRRRLARRAEAA